MISILLRALVIAAALATPLADAAAQRPAAHHANDRANYRIAVPPGWQVVANPDVDVAMTDPRAGLGLFVRVLEGPHVADSDAYRVLTDHYRDDLDYVVIRAGAKPLPHLSREGWAFVVRQTKAPVVEMVAIIPREPNGESSIYYQVRLTADVRRLDAIESEMDRLLAGFRLTGEAASMPVKPRTETVPFRPPRADTARGQGRSHADTLGERFEEWRLGYALRYPSDWRASRLNESTVRFSAGRDQRNREAAITIQNMAGTAGGGVYSRVGDVADAFRKQIAGLDPHAEFRNERAFSYSRTRLHLVGMQFTASYRVAGSQWRQWQIILPRPDGKIFLAWSLTAPDDRFDALAGIAGAMLDSWVIAP